VFLIVTADIRIFCTLANLALVVASLTEAGLKQGEGGAEEGECSEEVEMHLSQGGKIWTR
jgi:hypothetical protein